ncbi:MAG: hypothetical protein KG003_04250 [Bacteroidetes bacterium]|nr:hypothetical protein [Bacteroidota bacterium]
MKNSKLFTVLFFASGLLHAQQTFTLYPMNSIPQSSYLNPATRPDCKWYFGMPGLNSVYMQYANSGFNFNQFLKATEPGNGDSLILNVNKVLDLMDKKNYIALKFENTWLTGGFKFGNHFFNLNVTDKAHMRVSIPKDLFRFLIDGNGGDNLGETFEFHFKAGAVYYREYGIGYNYTLGDKLTLGGKLKYLQGFATINTNHADLDVTTNKEDYSLLLKTNLELNTASSWGRIINNPNEDFEPQNFSKSGNRGMGLDLGASYKWNDKIELSASVIDLGFINWKENTVNIVSRNPNAGFNFDGIHVKSNDTQSFDQYLSQLKDSILATFPLDTTTTTFRTTLSSEFFIYGSYMLSKKLTAGALFYGDFYNRRFYPGLTLNVKWKAGKALTLNLSNSFYSRSFFNIGLGGSLNLGAWQVYSIMDNVLAPFIPAGVKSISWRFGTNFTFGRERMKPKPENKMPVMETPVPTTN